MMSGDKDSAKIESAVNKRKSDAIKLGLDEKAELIASQLGKKTVRDGYYPATSVGGDFGSTFRKARYIGKAAPCSEYALEIIVCSEEFEDKSGNKEVMVFTRKQLLFPFLYKSRIVYASQASLREPGKIKVDVFRDENKWLSDLELLYSHIRLDQALKDNKGAAEKMLDKLSKQDDLKKRYGL
jgi:hypothetical protein